MRSAEAPSLLALDALFVAAHLGLALSLFGISAPMVAFLLDVRFLGDSTLVAVVFWGTVILWVALYALMRFDAARSKPTESSQAIGSWPEILGASTFPGGATAYYVGWYRLQREPASTRLVQQSLRGSLFLLDAASFLSSWG